MCNPISLILTEDKVFLPPEEFWNHSHSFIMEKNNIPNGLIGDKYLRLEVVPPEENIFINKETNEKLEVNDEWKVKVDEDNIPDWYKNDKPNQEYRAREAANKWLQNFPDNLVPGYKEVAGIFAKIISGDHSTLTAGIYSALHAGDNSELTAGSGSELTAGRYSALNAGYESILVAGNYSIFCAGEYSSFNLIWYDGKRTRTTVAYVGEDGIKSNTKYLGKDGKFTEVKE